MKENRLVKITSFVMLLTVVALTLVSGTYAKYTSSVTTTTATATVAKWDIKAGVKGSELSITGSNPTIAFNLFETINDTLNHAAETDVNTGKIAPGTEGSFEFSIKNDSEVSAEYSLTYNVTNAGNVPIEFSIDDGSTWTTSLANVAASADTKILAGNSKSVTVQWRWAFTGEGSSNFTSSQTDATDTTLGVKTTADTVSVSVTLHVDQVD